MSPGNRSDGGDGGNRGNRGRTADTGIPEAALTHDGFGIAAAGPNTTSLSLSPAIVHDTFLLAFHLS